MGSAISGNFGKYGGPEQSLRTAGADADERVLGNAELGGGNDVLTEALVGEVSAYLLEIYDGAEKEGQVQMVKLVTKMKEVKKRREF